MKVIQINCVCGPDAGSTGKIVWDLHNEFRAKGIDSLVIYGRGKRINDPSLIKLVPELYGNLQGLIARITGIMYGGCLLSTRRIINIIKREKPDVVHLQCINGHFVNVYKLISWLKENNVNTVCTLHAEIMYTGGCDHAIDCNQWRDENGCKQCSNYKEKTQSWFFDRTHIMWRKMRDAFCDTNEKFIITCVSPWLTERAKLSVVFARHDIRTVLNGVNTDIFSLQNELDNKKQSENSLIVFNAGGSFSEDIKSLKGGATIIELARRFSDENVEFFVAGNEDKKYNNFKNVRLLGYIKDQKKLAQVYQHAKVYLMVSKKETFGMPVAESLCCGTPVVGYKAGGPEMISLPEYSKFVDYGKIDELESALRSFLKKEFDREKISQIAIKKYGIESVCKEYINLYEELLSRRE